MGRDRVSDVVQDRAAAYPSSMIRAMQDQTVTPSTSGLADRAETLQQVRAELRDNHPRLTDKQIDLIADVAVELRLTRSRLGLEPVAVPPSPQRARVPALA
jgi:hypothetical protein